MTFKARVNDDGIKIDVAEDDLGSHTLYGALNEALEGELLPNRTAKVKVMYRGGEYTIDTILSLLSVDYDDKVRSQSKEFRKFHLTFNTVVTQRQLAGKKVYRKN